jgi:hypothetical protein
MNGGTAGARRQELPQPLRRLPFGLRWSHAAISRSKSDPSSGTGLFFSRRKSAARAVKWVYLSVCSVEKMRPYFADQVTGRLAAQSAEYAQTVNHGSRRSRSVLVPYARAKRTVESTSKRET